MSNEFEQPVEPMSRTEDLLRTGTEEPVIAMSEIEKILRGEHIDRPHSRVADLLLKYNPSDILIEKSITENGTYYASADGADGYYKVVVDTPVIPPTVLEHLVETISTNGTHTFTPGTGVDGYSDATITVDVPANVTSRTLKVNGTFSSAVDNKDGYDSVTVNVQEAPVKTTSLSVTANGTYEPGPASELSLTIPTIPDEVETEVSAGATITNFDNLRIEFTNKTTSATGHVDIYPSAIATRQIPMSFKNRTLIMGPDGDHYITIVNGGNSILVLQKGYTITAMRLTSESGYFSSVDVDVQPATMEKSITANGTYLASNDNVYGYSKATVNVPPVPVLVTKQIPNLPAPIASFSDGAVAPMMELKIEINPYQGGSGTPSPENIREISGYKGVHINNATFIDNINSDGQILWNWKYGNTDISAPLNICHYETVKDSNNNDIEVADLEWNYVLPFDTVYDEPEAIYEAPAGGLEAGTYYFTIKNDLWGGNNGKIVQFILAEALTEGQQIRKRSGAYNAAIENCTLGIFTSGADRTGTELAFTVETSSSGTNLGDTDGTGNCNHWHRVVLGYNRWKTSAIRQFLNSTAAAGGWWTPQNKWDVKPAYADNRDGFLKGYSDEILHYLQITKVITAQNTVTETGEMDITYDRVFLASLEQTYITPQIAGEGEYWEYYKRLLGRTSPASTGQNYARLIKYDINARTTARSRWLRSAYRGDACNVWSIYTSGYVLNGTAYHGLRVAPCLRIATRDLHTQYISWESEVGTIYKGEYNITNGTLKSYTHYDSYNGEIIDGEWMSDRDVYAEGTTPTIGAEVQVLSGSNYTTYQLQPVYPTSLLGDNNIFADTGNVLEGEYLHVNTEAGTLINKTITQNGSYCAARDDDADGYLTVDVNVSPNVGTKSITSNGTYTASSDELAGYSSVTVNVPPVGTVIPTIKLESTITITTEVV